MNHNSKKTGMVRFRNIILVLAVCLTGTATFTFGGTTYQPVSDNLLVNPDWENGIDGWTAETVNEEVIFRGEPRLLSAVAQDVPLDSFSAGQLLRLSGKIAVSPDDPTQERIDLGLILCGEGGTYISTQVENEEGSQLTDHEIYLSIPEGASYAHVYLNIWKNSPGNQMYFSDLMLEVVEKKTQDDNPVFRSEGVRDTTGMEVDGAGVPEMPSTQNGTADPVPDVQTEEPDITGTWYVCGGRTEEGEIDASQLAMLGIAGFSITLDADGTAAGEIYEETVTGTWSFDGVQGIITLDDEDESFVKEDDRLILEGEGISLVFSREQPDLPSVDIAPAVADAQYTDYYGTWNATVMIMYGAGTYMEATGRRIQVTMHNVTVTYLEETLDPETLEVTKTEKYKLSGELQEDGSIYIDTDKINGMSFLMSGMGMNTGALSFSLREDGRMVLDFPDLNAQNDAVLDENGISAEGLYYIFEKE